MSERFFPVLFYSNNQLLWTTCQRPTIFVQVSVNLNFLYSMVTKRENKHKATFVKSTLICGSMVSYVRKDEVALATLVTQQKDRGLLGKEGSVCSHK